MATTQTAAPAPKRARKAEPKKPLKEGAGRRKGPAKAPIADNPAQARAERKLDAQRAAKRTAVQVKPAQSKGDILVSLMRRPQGASIDEMSKASGWQKHSVRGFMAGTLKAKKGMTINATKEGEGDDRRMVYRIPAEEGV